MTPLEELVRERIGRGGPIAVDALVETAQFHPEHGYYATRDPLGTAGDFTTAPEISQVFGELIGAWAAAVWEQMGRPEGVVLAEAGPGRGTLMADACIALGYVSDILSHAEIHLVERSPAMRRLQERALSHHSPRWHDRLADLPEAPLILIANEYLDCFPPRQLVRTPGGWAERRVGLEAGRLALMPGTPAAECADLVPAHLRDSPVGTIFEAHAALERAMSPLARRLARHGGAALFVDYGHDQPAVGETLQAVRRHRPVDPLADLGECDISAHVDFSAVARGLAEHGNVVHGPVTQRQFLRCLLIEARTDRLAGRLSRRSERHSIRAATARLIDPAGMGTLFKAIAATASGMPQPPGFDPVPERC